MVERNILSSAVLIESKVAGIRTETHMAVSAIEDAPVGQQALVRHDCAFLFPDILALPNLTPVYIVEELIRRRM